MWFTRVGDGGATLLHGPAQVYFKAPILLFLFKKESFLRDSKSFSGGFSQKTQKRCHGVMDWGARRDDGSFVAGWRTPTTQSASQETPTDAPPERYPCSGSAPATKYSEGEHPVFAS